MARTERTVQQKIKAIEWAIHSTNRELCRIQSDEFIPCDVKEKQSEAHRAYSKTLFRMLEDLKSRQ